MGVSRDSGCLGYRLKRDTCSEGGKDLKVSQWTRRLLSFHALAKAPGIQGTRHALNGKPVEVASKRLTCEYELSL